MSDDRLIDPDQRYVELYVDELHWVKLAELAMERGVVVDKLIGAILEHFLVKLKKIQYEEVSDSILKVDVTLEPVRKDRPFFDALITDREASQRARNVSKTITDLDELEMDWGDL